MVNTGESVYLKDGRVVLVIRPFDENFMVCLLEDNHVVLIEKCEFQGREGDREHTDGHACIDLPPVSVTRR